MKVKYYELHVTADIPIYNVDRLLGYKSGWWASRVSKDIDHKGKKDLTIMTRQTKTQRLAFQEISAIRRLCKAFGVHIIRAKIEAVIYDKREKS